MKQTCGSVREWLGAFADGELDPARTEQVRGHLETCAGCRRELDQIEQLNKLVKSVPHPELAEDYWYWQQHRFWRRINQGRRGLARPLRRPFLSGRFVGMTAGLAVVAVVIIAGWGMLGQGRRGDVGRYLMMEKSAGTQPGAVAVRPETVQTERRAAEPVADAARAKIGGRADELGEVPAAAGRDAEKARVGYAGKGAGASGTASASKPATAPRRGAATEMEIATEEPGEGLAAAPAADEQRFVASSKKESRIVSGPVLLESPPLPDADALDTGTVLLNVKTDSAGRVLNAAVRRSSGSSKLDSVAVRQIRQSRFRAAVRKNRSVPSSFQYPYRFQRKQAKPQEQEKPQTEQKPREEHKLQQEQNAPAQDDKSQQQDSGKQATPLKGKTKK